MSLHVDVVGTSVPKILQIRFPVEAATSALECYCSYYACLWRLLPPSGQAVFSSSLYSWRPGPLVGTWWVWKDYMHLRKGIYKAKTKMHTLQTPALQPPRPQKAYRWVQAATWQLADTGKNRDPLGAPHLDVYVQLHWQELSRESAE